MFYENTCTCTFVVKILKEFELIVGDGAAKRVVDNWRKHLPSISHPEASELDALKAMDKSLRPPGPTGKSPSVFTIFEVHLV